MKVVLYRDRFVMHGSGKAPNASAAAQPAALGGQTRRVALGGELRPVALGGMLRTRRLG